MFSKFSISTWERKKNPVTVALHYPCPSPNWMWGAERRTAWIVIDLWGRSWRPKRELSHRNKDWWRSLKGSRPPAYRPRPGLEPSSLQLWPVNTHWSLLHPGNYWIWEEMVSAPRKPGKDGQAPGHEYCQSQKGTHRLLTADRHLCRKTCW